jgi:hypothetical protein
MTYIVLSNDMVVVTLSSDPKKPEKYSTDNLHEAEERALMLSRIMTGIYHVGKIIETFKTSHEENKS